MVIIRIEHDNYSCPPQYLVVEDEDCFSRAEILFSKHMERCVIKNMTRVGLGGDVINAWAQ